MTNFTSIDFETANAKRSSACAIGMAKVVDGKIVDTFRRFIKPDPLEFNYINIAIHGITPDMVASSPTFFQLWEEIQTFINGDVLVAHNVSFEQSVINQCHADNGMTLPEYEYLCTLYMSRLNYPNRAGYKLDDLCKDLLGKSINHHDPLEDALVCAELALHHFDKFGVHDIPRLIKGMYVVPQRHKVEWKNLKGITPSIDELDPNHPLFEKKVVFTGVLETMSRERAVALLVNCGGVYQDGLRMDTDYLVLGGQEYKKESLFMKESKKLITAERYNEKGSNINIIYEEDFLALIG